MRRQSTMARSNVELPPNYSEAVLYRDGSFKGGIPNNNGGSRRASRNSRNEPMSPPPSYDAVAIDNDEDDIVFRIPETVHEDESNSSHDSNESRDTNSSSSSSQADRQSAGTESALPDVVTLQEGGNSPMTRHDTPV